MKYAYKAKFKTQTNPSNSVIWKHVSKTAFVGIETLKFGMTDTVPTFTDENIALFYMKIKAFV